MKKYFTIPDWYSNYCEFADILHKRNEWFIGLRYAAAIFLLLILLSVRFLFNSELPVLHQAILFCFPVIILLYNGIFHRRLTSISGEHDYVNENHFALQQILADLVTLGALVYFTGGIESPFGMLFVLHTVISGLMLPGRFVAALAAAMIIFYNGCAWLEFTMLIPHQPLGSILPHPVFAIYIFVLAATLIFTMVIVSSAFISFRIAGETARLQNALFASYKEIETAEMEKQRYVMAVVHEIKQPVSAVISFLRIIAQKILGEIPAPVEERIHKAIARCDEAVEMINNILRLSRLKLMNEIHTEEIDLAGLLRGAIDKYAAPMHEKNVHLELTVPDEEVKTIGDIFLLNIALSNIIGNAIKYNHTGGTIRCSLKREKQTALIHIEDSGIGIPDGQREKAFNTFFRASNLNTKNIEGAGIGLSAVQQIIARHGGTITIDSPSALGSKEFPGTAITISLPPAVAG